MTYNVDCFFYKSPQLSMIFSQDNSFSNKDLTSKSIVIGWKVSSLSLNIASVRYRAFLPLLSLSSCRYIPKIFSTSNVGNLTDINVLIFVKVFMAEDLALAQTARLHNIPYVMDLCDNIFIASYQTKKGASPADIFMAMAYQAAAIVVPTAALAKVVKSKIDAAIPVVVIPDGSENVDLIHRAEKLLKLARLQHRNPLQARIKLLALKLIKKFRHLCAASATDLKIEAKAYCKRYHSLLLQRLNGLYLKQYVASQKLIRIRHRYLSKGERSAAFKSILWFGNHGAPHAHFGMLDLLLIRESLERIAAEFDVELVVVSNHFRKYDKYIRPLAIKSRYVEWSPGAMEREFRMADVVVIPNSLDAFSLCKSANRAVLALSHGIPVIATSTEALAPLADCIELDDFYIGLKRYLTDSLYSQDHLEQSAAIIAREFGPASIASAWQEVLVNVMHQPVVKKIPADLVGVLYLVQDIDLLMPIFLEATKQGMSIEAWCSLGLVQKSPRTLHLLRKHGWSLRIIPNDLAGFQTEWFSKPGATLICAAESTLPPHQFGHKLTLAANKAGINTATLQHGFENVGLTYTDHLHDIKKIDFASKHIYLWGSFDSLLADIPEKTRARCIPAGCPKPSSIEPVDLTHLLPSNKMVVGVFENLHWHRYSEQYRKFFIDGLQEAIDAFPEVVFLVKPHHAGIWFTSRNKSRNLVGDNVLIADPQEVAWEPYTAPQLFSNIDAVITTPSTVALDAARACLPTALVAGFMPLKNYEPLFALRQMQDWQAFVSYVQTPGQRQSLLDKSEAFVSRVLVPGDAAQKIVTDLIHQKTKS